MLFLRKRLFLSGNETLQKTAAGVEVSALIFRIESGLINLRRLNMNRWRLAFNRWRLDLNLRRWKLNLQRVGSNRWRWKVNLRQLAFNLQRVGSNLRRWKVNLRRVGFNRWRLEQEFGKMRRNSPFLIHFRRKHEHFMFMLNLNWWQSRQRRGYL
jgi:hypothetical protein